MLPNSGSPGTANTGTANADLGQSGTTVGMTAGLEPLRWMKAMLSSMLNPNAGGIPNEQEDNGYTADEALGITYTDESAQLNMLKLNTDTLWSLPVAILTIFDGSVAHICSTFIAHNCRIRPHHAKSIRQVQEGCVWKGSRKEHC